MDFAVGFKQHKCLDVHLSAVEPPSLHGDRGRKFPHGCVERVDPHRTLRGITGGHEVAGSSTIPRDRNRVHIVLVRAQIEFAAIDPERGQAPHDQQQRQKQRHARQRRTAASEQGEVKLDAGGYEEQRDEEAEADRLQLLAQRVACAPQRAAPGGAPCGVVARASSAAA